MIWQEPDVTVLGGGLAGSEAAWQLANRGHKVVLVDMKPTVMSPAHQSPVLAELVCSNSLRSNDPMVPAGLVKHELAKAGSIVVACAEKHKVPAGSALAVERFGFGRAVTQALALHPGIRIERRLAHRLPDGPTILATGPLTGGALARHVRHLLGGERLYFYDAIAPIVSADTIDPEHSFRASRWDKGDEDGGDYINCPVDKATYEAIVGEIAQARKVLPHAFEEPRFFEGCLPIEVMVSRGLDVLRHGPMRPVGLTDPKTGKWPYGCLQLRPENEYKSAYNLVGFQTRLAYPEQKRIFSMIPGLRNAEFLRYGSIHRNTYIDSPRLLGAALELKARPNVQVAGLLTGVEGYIESCAIGCLAALFCDARLRGKPIVPPPKTTALGALYHHVTRARGEKEAFGPTNINFGLLPRPVVEPGRRMKKKERREAMAKKAMDDFPGWLQRLEAAG